MKNHFITPYIGNKRGEVERIYEYIKDDIKKVKTIVEPFCGTSAMSYYISTLHPNKYKYILNDNDEKLIELYNIMKDKKRLKKFEKKVNELAKTIDSKDKFLQIKKYDTIEAYYVLQKIYHLRPGMYDLNYIYKYIDIRGCPIVSFLHSEDVEIRQGSGDDIVKEMRDDKRAFVFIDPPYLISCNGFYNDPAGNIYEYFVKNKLDDMRAKICLVLEVNWIILLLFDGYIKLEYPKAYNMSKQKTMHCLISNI